MVYVIVDMQEGPDYNTTITDFQNKESLIHNIVKLHITKHYNPLT